MAKLTSILQERFRKKEKPKMTELAEQASAGNLTVFAGFFGMTGSSEKEKAFLEELLHKYVLEEESLPQDLDSLLAITSEVKAINNQAAILHGERIKKAQEILKKYRDGAFTAWLKAAYGNRQTPYNFLQYYEFYMSIPQSLRPQLETMPRQAVYTLASRQAPLIDKTEIVRKFNGETKQEMMTLIRSCFPLKEEDKRQENVAENTVKQLQRVADLFTQGKPKFSTKQKNTLLKLLEEIKFHVQKDE